MQDGKALQSGTSHDLGQNFGKAFNVTFQNEKGEREHVWQTSWGLSTRMIGALIMAHCDDGGLVLPPRLAPIHVAVVPIYKKDEERVAVLEAAGRVAAELREDGLAVELDARDGLKPGAKYFEWERKGVPVRIELGPRDLVEQAVMIKRRVGGTDAAGKPIKEKLALQDLGLSIGTVLDEIQVALYDAARARTEREHGLRRHLGRVRAGLPGRRIALRLRPLGRHDRDRARHQGRDQGHDPLPALPRGTRPTACSSAAGASRPAGLRRSACCSRRTTRRERLEHRRARQVPQGVLPHPARAGLGGVREPLGHRQRGGVECLVCAVRCGAGPSSRPS
jgi:hypothetical protein